MIEGSTYEIGPGRRNAFDAAIDPFRCTSVLDVNLGPGVPRPRRCQLWTHDVDEPHESGWMPLNRPGMFGDSNRWKGWGYVEEHEVSGRAA